MGELKSLKKFLRNSRTAFATWDLVTWTDTTPPGGFGSELNRSEARVLVFRDFEKMYQVWTSTLKHNTDPDFRSKGRIRAVSRQDGSDLTVVSISDPNQADCYHTELDLEGYLTPRIAHLLKTHPEPFQAMRKDLKRFEIRKDDRPMGFGIDDELRLAQWSPDLRIYLGDIIVARVTYIARNEEWGLKPGHVVLGLVLQEYLPAMNPKAQLWLGGEQHHLN